ncbi:type II toxin-antitoxin system VapC family toxin [Kineococcus rubinsiae]|uniref:type II toxin-antitoxin system VapC family toxin n=1 Tax=Kineococcus rubinsiae TaxID=2609562 RepID=UPI0014306CA7|nr:PIN domain-containing protein [Kineococcus rubinsiae]
MPVSRPRVYADADLFLSVLKGEPRHAEALRVLEAAERRDIQLVASRLLAVEVGGYGGDRPGPGPAEDLLTRFLDGVGTEWVEVDLLVTREARRLAWEYRLRAGDAVHLATAVRRKADHFMSFDRGFPHGQNVEGTAVSEPVVVWQPTLYDQ